MMCVILGEPPKALSTALRSLYCIYIKNGATIDSVGNTIERERRRNRLGSEVSFCFLYLFRATCSARFHPSLYGWTEKLSKDYIWYCTTHHSMTSAGGHTLSYCFPPFFLFPGDTDGLDRPVIYEDVENWRVRIRPAVYRIMFIGDVIIVKNIKIYLPRIFGTRRTASADRGLWRPAAIWAGRLCCRIVPKLAVPCSIRYIIINHFQLVKKERRVRIRRDGQKNSIKLSICL